MFEPKFIYTTDMINDLLKIERFRTALEYLYLPTRIKQELIYKAKMKKTHFSTSIEGNILSYNQVEQVINQKGNHTKINAEKIYEMAEKATKKEETNHLLYSLSKKDKIFFGTRIQKYQVKRFRIYRIIFIFRGFHYEIP